MRHRAACRNSTRSGLPKWRAGAERVGAQKAGRDAITVFTLAVLPGAVIALRGVFAIDPGSARERLLDGALPDGE